MQGRFGERGTRRVMDYSRMDCVHNELRSSVAVGAERTGTAGDDRM